MTSSLTLDEKMIMTQPMIEASSVYKSYGNNLVLKGVSVAVERQKVACILGPSGSGKSTFLRCLNRLETIDSGSIRIGGELIGYREKGDRLHDMRNSELALQRRRTGMVFQGFNLFLHMTALQNVMEAPRTVLRAGRRDAERLALELLDRVGLAAHKDKYPAQLSGGQQQRVAIARAMAMNPDVLLFDEPTSALDPELVGEVLDVMRDLAESGMTMIIVTHEIQFALDVADTAIVMADGVVIEEGDPRQVLTDPQHPRSRQFLSHTG